MVSRRELVVLQAIALSFLGLAVIASPPAAGQGTGSGGCYFGVCPGGNGGAVAPNPAPATPKPQPGPAPSASFSSCTNCWVDGNGYATHRSGSLASCQAICAREGRCQTFEFHYPDNTCNLFDVRKPNKGKGASTVGWKN
jgi:PAN domain